MCSRQTSVLQRPESFRARLEWRRKIPIGRATPRKHTARNERTHMIIALLAFVAVIAVLFLLAVGGYNALVMLRNRYKNAFAQIDVQLKRRYDLIPNLVETAKGYLKHERETLERVMAARNGASAAQVQAAANPGDVGAMRALGAAEGNLAGTLTRFFAVAEAYPNLKADASMARVMEELSSTENRIGFARQAFNDSVMEYNNKRESFPSNIIAGMFNFAPAEMFVIDTPEQKEAPKVSFA
jgi:LemA protein